MLSITKKFTITIGLLTLCSGHISASDSPSQNDVMDAIYQVAGAQTPPKTVRFIEGITAPFEEYDLPEEINEHILGFLKDSKDISSISLVNKWSCNWADEKPYLKVSAKIKACMFSELLRHKTKLRSLNMLECFDLPIEAISKALTLCPDLESVSLKSNVLIDTNLEMIASSCPGLSKLILRDCQEISKSGIEAVLEKCQNLSFLYLRGCIRVEIERLEVAIFKHTKLTSLNVEGISLSYDAIGERIPNLHSLYLSSQFITVAHLAPVIHKMLNLRLLSLNGCVRIEDADISSIRESHPTLRIVCDY